MFGPHGLGVCGCGGATDHQGRTIKGGGGNAQDWLRVSNFPGWGEVIRAIRRPVCVRRTDWGCAGVVAGQRTRRP